MQSVFFFDLYSVIAAERKILMTNHQIIFTFSSENENENGEDVQIVFFFLNFVWPSKYTAKCVQLTNTNSTRHIQNELKFLWLDVKTRHIFLTCFDMFNVSHSIYRDKGIRTRE